MNEHLGFHFMLVITGFFGGQGQAHDGWNKNSHQHNSHHDEICPKEDPKTHRCYELTTRNSTCLVATLTGCDPDYTRFCKLQMEYQRKPCMIKTCKDIGCCKGYTEDKYGRCVSEADEAIRCENGGTKTYYGQCSCTEHFIGSRCEFPKCIGSCLNGGRCELDKGVPKCICPSTLYSGIHCQKVSCVDSCLNGGECIQDGVLSRCKCTHGYQGDRCQFPIKENCPVVQSKSQAACGPIRNECETDFDCVNKTHKTACCHNGCKGVCRVPELNQCTFKGNVYNSGETFSPDSCKKCVCQMYGEVTCSTIECTAQRCPAGQKSIKVAGHCCQVCPGKENTDKDVPRFTNCPEQFIVLDVSNNSDAAHLPHMKLNAVDVSGTKLNVYYTQEKFNHTRNPEISQNIHIVTAYSECDTHGRRAECNFRVIVRDRFPPVFKTCPADIYAQEDDIISWSEPEVYDNVDLYNVKVDGDLIRDRNLPVGTYAVSYTAWDYDMNQAICTFIVRIHRKSYYDQDTDTDDHYYGKVPVGTVVGISTGILVTMALCVCFTIRVAQLRREQEEERNERAGEQIDETIFSVNDPNAEHNPDLNENIDMKLPYLPEYSPRLDPPPYEQIELGVGDKVGAPIYEEITEVSTLAAAQVSQESENNEDTGEVNNAFATEGP